jgi:predicted amidohydrolase
LPTTSAPVRTVIAGRRFTSAMTDRLTVRIAVPRHHRNGSCPIASGRRAYHRAMRTMRVALVQVEARDDVADNLSRAAAMAAEAAVDADLVILPEYVQYRGGAAGFRASAAPVPGPTTAPLAAVAREHGCWVLAGSHAEASSDPERPYNTAALFDRSGVLAARYRKLHLFDVSVDDGPTDMESARVTAGDRAVVASVDGVGLGLSICYDLRFPELYRDQSERGARILLAPAAFTDRTGRDHWHLLTRARAMENQCFLLAPAQCGRHSERRSSYGHSLVADPWGRIVAEREEAPGLLVADIDLAEIDRVRQALPALTHRRL